MTKKLLKEEYVVLTDQRILAEELKNSVQVCYKESRYVAVLCIIVCGIDALASGNKDLGLTAHKKIYLKILEKHFPGLCEKLGARNFYDRYRSGMVHHFHPMKGYIMSQDHDLNGQYVAEVEIEGRPGTRISINMDRLIQDFIRLCDYVISGNPVP
jgi:hypothetical protein